MVKKINFLYNDTGLFILQVYVPSGSIYEHESNKKIYGISHFLEHLLFKNTENYSGKELLESFTKLGGYYNASTDKDETVFYVKTMTDNYELAIELLYNIVCKPIFTKEEVEKERKVILEEYAETKDDLEDTVYENGMKSFLCKDNIYYNSVIGIKTHLETINIKDIIKYYSYRFKECIILVNCDKKFKNQIKNLLYQTFGQEKKLHFNEIFSLHKTACIEIKINKRINIIANKTTQYNSQMIFKGFKFSNIVENTILDFIKYCMTSAGLFSILYYKLREEKGLVYSITLTNEKFRYLGLVKITFGTSNKDTYNIISVIMQILSDFKINGLDQQRLNFFKESYINNIRYKLTNEEYRTMWHGKNLFYGVQFSEKKFIQTIQSITNEDIKRIANKVFNNQQMSVMTIGPYKDHKTLHENLNLITL